MSQSQQTVTPKTQRRPSRVVAADSERRQIELLLALRAPSCNHLLELFSRAGDGWLELVFIVSEPLYDAETEVIPVIQEILELAERLAPDFLVLPESAADPQSFAGARHLYERITSSSKQGGKEP